MYTYSVMSFIGMLRKFILALLLCALLSPPAPVAASSQVAVILFFCSIAAVVPGPWQQPLQYLSFQKETLLLGILLFTLRFFLMILVAWLLQKLLRYDALKFASLSVYTIPAMSIALLLDQSSRQPLIDALSLSSAASFILSICHSALPSDYLESISHAPNLLQQRWSAADLGDRPMNDKIFPALLFLIASVVALLLLLRKLLNMCIMSLGMMTISALFLTQLSASFILPLVPDLRNSFGCVLCIIQLFTAPYLRRRSLPLPTEKNRRLFIFCVIPIAMGFSSEGVELSVLIQAFLDAKVLFAAVIKHSHPSDPTHPKHSRNASFRFSAIVFSLALLFLLAFDVFYFQKTSSYVFDLIKFAHSEAMQLNLTFIAVFVLSWGPNYDAGFPMLLIVVITVLLPSLKG